MESGPGYTDVLQGLDPHQKCSGSIKQVLELSGHMLRPSYLASLFQKIFRGRSAKRQLRAKDRFCLKEPPPSS